VFDNPDAEWKFSVIETPDQFPMEIPEFAIRDSIMFPSAEMYVLNNLIFLEDKEEYIISIDSREKSVEAYFKPSVSITEKIRFLTKRVLIRSLELRNIFFIHGAAIEWDGSSIIFAGSSGSGKTSALITLLEKGKKLITDDTVLFKEQIVLPFYIRSMIHRDMLKTFPKLKKGIGSNATWVSEAKGWWMDIGDIFSFHAKGLPLSKIFYLYVWKSSKTRCEEISKKEMLSKLYRTYIQETTQIPLDTGLHDKVFAAYHSLLEHVDCYKLFVGKDREELIDVIEHVVEA
jgi:hypothetical protein